MTAMRRAVSKNEQFSPINESRQRDGLVLGGGMRISVQAMKKGGEQTGRARALFYSSAFALSCCLLLGGGASNTYLTNALLQILTLPSLLLALWCLRWRELQSPSRFALWLILAAFLSVALQLIPWPPAVWSSLPFHEKVRAARDALGTTGQWAPISVTPDATLVGVLTLLPPLTIFVSVISLSARERRLLTLIPLAFGCVNAFIGLLQVAQGQESPLYFYGHSGADASVGLFTNRNHEAALLYSVSPFAAAWISAIAPEISIRRGSQSSTFAIIKLLGASITVFILVVATLMTRSRAGVILVMVAISGSLALQRWRNFSGDRMRAAGLYASVAFLAVVLGLQYGLYSILTRFEADPYADARVSLARITALAAFAAAPLGTGIGSFVPIYASIERREDLLPDRYANHAHNDFLEIALETGLPGLALIFGFGTWFVFCARDIWRGALPGIDVLMARAATLSIGMLLTHELVDYALRTDAILGFFAFSCSFLASSAEVPGAPLHPYPADRDDQRLGKALPLPTTARPSNVSRCHF